MGGTIARELERVLSSIPTPLSDMIRVSKTFHPESMAGGDTSVILLLIYLIFACFLMINQEKFTFC